jgi:protein TonB
VGAIVAGELILGQHVALELRLPNVGLPIRVRALVSYQSKLHCGFEFVGLSAEQREMIRYWIYRASQPGEFRHFRTEIVEATPAAPVVVTETAAKPRRRVRVGRRMFYLLAACVLLTAGLGWWQWQKSWNELEKQSPVGDAGLRVAPATMEQRIVSKVEPLYPEIARSSGTEGLVVLDALIGTDGSVKRLRPVSGSDSLVEAATEAVQRWKFLPYIASGKAIEVETTLAVDFRLN